MIQNMMIENTFPEWWQAHGAREACESAWNASARARDDQTTRRLESVLRHLGARLKSTRAEHDPVEAVQGLILAEFRDLRLDV